MLGQRLSGILLHPTSLPSSGGIGDLGPAAHDFVEFLGEARQGLWQVLPLSPAGLGNSPYSSTSAFAGNPLLISLERLAERGMLASECALSLKNGGGPVDYERVHATKLPLLREAARNFLKNAQGDRCARFDRFCAESSWWLEDFVLFDALRGRFHGESWNRWPHELAHREAAALDRARSEHAEELDIGRVLQFAFFEQWSALRAHCHRRGVRIVGDVAIFVSYDSADVWTHPELFHLDREREPEFVAGVPPDAFSDDGQRWGNPLYRWAALRDRGYDWWVRRVRWALASCDILRLDHFRGFVQYWEIPAREPTAVHGRWADGPKDDLFRVLRATLGDLPFIAEDLGLITDEVRQMRARLEIPGMRVMQFAFANPGAHIYLPHRFERNTVVYTGTHDNDTTAGWWKTCGEQERLAATAYFGDAGDGIHWAMMRSAMASVANQCIFPAQDILGLGSDARMNVPGQSDGNWTWRLKADALGSCLARKMADLMEVTDRLPGGEQQPYSEASADFAA